jgi:hypothetical protein
MWPGAWISRTHEARVRPDFVRTRAHRTHGLLEKALEGMKAQESTDRLIAPLARAAIVIRERTLEVSKAPKWAFWLPSPASPAAPRRDVANDHGNVTRAAP